MVFRQALGVEEAGAYFKRRHEGNRLAIHHLERDGAIHGVSGVGSVRRVVRKKVAREHVRAAVVCLYERADRGVGCRSGTSPSVDRTEVSRRKNVLAELVDEPFVMEYRGKVKLLYLVDERGVPYDYYVILAEGTEIAVVVVVPGNVRKVHEDVGHALGNGLSLKPVGSLSVVRYFGKSDALRLKAHGRLCGAYVSIEERCVINPLGVPYPAEHYAVEGAESTLGAPCPFAEIIVHSQGNLTEYIQYDCLAVRCRGTMERKKVRCLRVVAPRSGLKHIGAVVKLGVAVEGTVYAVCLHELRVRASDVVCKDLLADNHVVKCCKDFVRAQLAIKIRHLKFYLRRELPPRPTVGAASTVLRISSFVKISEFP